MNKYPPKGYKTLEFALPHSFQYRFGFDLTSAAKVHTILPILRTNETMNVIENIEVSPRHANFAEETGSLIQPMSIVPKISLSITSYMSEWARDTDKIQQLHIKWFPIYIAFLDSLEAMDDLTDLQVEDLMELQHGVGAKQTYPQYTNNKLPDADNYPMSTINKAEARADVGLTTTDVLEGVSFIEDLMFDSVSRFSNKGMIKKAWGKTTHGNITPDKAYTYSSNNFTQPTVKRGNAYTFCGIAMILPQAGSLGQLVHENEVTSGTHVHNIVKIRFDEWNQRFDQTPI